MGNGMGRPVQSLHPAPPACPRLTNDTPYRNDQDHKWNITGSEVPPSAAPLGPKPGQITPRPQHQADRRIEA